MKTPDTGLFWFRFANAAGRVATGWQRSGGPAPLLSSVSGRQIVAALAAVIPSKRPLLTSTHNHEGPAKQGCRCSHLPPLTVGVLDKPVRANVRAPAGWDWCSPSQRCRLGRVRAGFAVAS